MSVSLFFFFSSLDEFKFYWILCERRIILPFWFEKPSSWDRFYNVKIRLTFLTKSHSHIVNKLTDYSRQKVEEEKKTESESIARQKTITFSPKKCDLCRENVEDETEKKCSKKGVIHRKLCMRIIESWSNNIGRMWSAHKYVGQLKNNEKKQEWNLLLLNRLDQFCFSFFYSLSRESLNEVNTVHS